MSDSKATTRPSLYLIDAYAQIFRAFFAVRGFTTSKGVPTNAVYGVVTILNKLLTQAKPDAVVVCFDAAGDNFRHEMYPDYKSTRARMPEELVTQLPLIRRLVKAMNLAEVELPGFEADDLIGTLAVRGVADGYDVTIVSGDKDMMQLVGDHVRLFDPMKERVSTAKEVIEKFSVPPDRVIEVMALMGDSSDNVPGIPGIGEVWAKKLIAQFHDVEGVLSGVADIKANGVRKKVEENGELARLSRELVTIRTDVPVSVEADLLALKEPDRDALRALYEELEFNSLLKTMADTGEEAPARETAPKNYKAITDLRELTQLAARIRTRGQVSVDLETTSLDPLQADVVGICLSLAEDEGYYIPVAHTGEGAESQLGLAPAMTVLAPLLSDPAIAKVGQNLKYDLQVLDRAGISLAGITFDTMLADYVLFPNRRSHGLDALALEYLDHHMIAYSEVAGKGAKQIPFAEVAVDVATPYGAEDAEITWRLYQDLSPRLDQSGLRPLFDELEMPLLPVLARMERHGFLLDLDHLAAMSKEMEGHIAHLTEQIHIIAGEEFNIASPKQLQVILFDKLGLKPTKKTKTGFSTDEEVLSKLAQEHELPDKILQLRQYAKLKSTYVDALPQLVNPHTGRVHTSLNQTVAATGRLSSTDPNLQNIPIRTEEGRRIRQAFICPAGSRLVSADYSQIELRILAHVARDAELIQAFTDGEDIHRRTASGVFGIHEGLVTDEMRRAAKAINFGIIYGMGAFSLAGELGVSQREAKETIERYFERYAGVRRWLDETQQSAAECGYVTTLFGRRRDIPELSMKGAQMRAAGERLATNTVIQGTAADIIKRAMLAVDRRLGELADGTNMLLQVHDELIFEVDESRVDSLSEMVRQEMMGAAELAVPLVVDIGVGDNWGEAH